MLRLGGHLYDLVGAVVHSGQTMEHGHYVSIVISPPYRETHLAFLCNDDQIPARLNKPMLEAHLRQGYVLAYERWTVANLPGVPSPGLKQGQQF